MSQKAIEFIREYAKHHFTFTGDEIFEQFRNEGHVPVTEDAGRASRINWGNMMTATDRLGFHKIIGKARPTAPHCHVSTVSLRQSLIYEGEIPEGFNPDYEYLQYLWKQCTERNMKWKDALKYAYQRGVETGLEYENSNSE